jgi:hypothetical protein
MLLQLPRTAGNAAVSRLIARLAIQRQDNDGSGSDPGSQGGCAGAIGIVDALSDENAADDQSSTNVQTQVELVAIDGPFRRNSPDRGMYPPDR